MIHVLADSPLFKGFKEEEITEIINAAHYKVSSYSKNEIICQKGDTVNSIMIITKGNIRTEMLDSTGNTFRIDDIFISHIVGPGFLYGDNNYFPVNVVANVNTSVLFINKKSFEYLFTKYPQLIYNYLDIISNKTQFLAKKIKNVFLQSIEGKIAIYLLSQIESKNSLNFEMDNNQTWLAERFNVARPSVARVFKQMRSRGIITTEGRKITIIDHKKLKSCVS